MRLEETGRRPLPKGTTLCVRDKRYIVDRLLGAGGFSLVYEAHAEDSAAVFAIKEFFPVPDRNGAAVAFREGTTVKAVPGHEGEYEQGLQRFQREGLIGGTVSGWAYQTIAFQEVCGGYAVMRRESADMVSLAGLLERWRQESPLPYTGNVEDRDPVFVDLVRVGYALRVVDSLLAVLTTIHSQGYLHLDLSEQNVIWAGLDQRTGRNCAAFVADYGSAMPVVEGESDSREPLCLPENDYFSPPEVLQQRVPTRASDIYSAGMILFYLCCGRSALPYRPSHPVDWSVKHALRKLRIPDFVRERLRSILYRATKQNPRHRYQTATEMQTAVRQLINALPVHPINPDNTESFSLYSLKSMLEGSRDQHYNWAVELCDRRQKDRALAGTELYTALTWQSFADDVDFLEKLFPEGMLQTMQAHWSAGGQRGSAAAAPIMCGNYDQALRERLCGLVCRAEMRRLLIRCRSLLDNETQYAADERVLIQLLGEDGDFLWSCLTHCRTRDHHYVGLALLALYALLGPKDFHETLGSPRVARSLFEAL